MYVTGSIGLVYFTYVALVVLFFVWFIIKVRKPATTHYEEKETGMDKREFRFLIGLTLVMVVFFLLTLTNVVRWQEWRLWSSPQVSKTCRISVADYQFRFPENPMTFKKGEFVEFVATTSDVTYGLGVFRKDGTMVFQFTVLPGYENRFVWNFAETGSYDIRSTEYSGPKHSEMVVRNVINVL